MVRDRGGVVVEWTGAVVCNGWCKRVHVLRELGVEFRWPLYKKPTCVIDVETNLPCNFRSGVCVGFGGVEVLKKK